MGRAVSHWFGNLVAFIVILCFYPLYDFSPLLAFSMSAILTFLCGWGMYLLCPETKNKGVSDILAEMNKDETPIENDSSETTPLFQK